MSERDDNLLREIEALHILLARIRLLVNRKASSLVGFEHSVAMSARKRVDRMLTDTRHVWNALAPAGKEVPWPESHPGYFQCEHDECTSVAITTRPGESGEPTVCADHYAELALHDMAKKLEPAPGESMHQGPWRLVSAPWLSNLADGIESSIREGYEPIGIPFEADGSWHQAMLQPPELVREVNWSGVEEDPIQFGNLEGSSDAQD